MNENNGVDISMISAVAEDDPRLFSSLIHLPTFAKNGEKVGFRQTIINEIIHIC